MYMQNDVSQVKRDISRFVGSKVMLETNKGRSRSLVTSGTIESCYPAIFTVMLDNQSPGQKRTASYSYTDVLTRAVEITVL
ncbi:MAG: Veg family protein [Defluviitaleaceae bacterium]|nr:Veg family protein [Defluviitaleaceae bacterium]